MPAYMKNLCVLFCSCFVPCQLSRQVQLRFYPNDTSPTFSSNITHTGFYAFEQIVVIFRSTRFADTRYQAEQLVAVCLCTQLYQKGVIQAAVTTTTSFPLPTSYSESVATLLGNIMPRRVSKDDKLPQNATASRVS